MIRNNLPLLNQMMKDLQDYKGSLGPGPYWLANQENTITWLSHNELSTFRQYDPTSKALGNFSGSSYWPNLDQRTQRSREISASFLYRLVRKLQLRPVLNAYNSLVREQILPARLVSLYAQSLSQLIELKDTDSNFAKIEFYTEDQPSDLLVIQGKQLTPISAEKFLLFLRLKEILKLQELSTFVEIGPGAGQLNEIIAKVYPGCKQFLIDIPPQLYVTELFLASMFGEAVMPYESSRTCFDFRSTTQTIYPIAPWIAEQAELPKIDLFMSQIFEEMPHDTVADYLKLARKWESRYVFVTTILSKHGEKAFSPAQYKAALPEYELLYQEKSMPDSLPTPNGTTNPSYDLLFKRK